jgi:tetratricopeptide (TPR) repeat protein
VGESGSGKTALLANWLNRHRRQHPNEVTLVHFIGSTVASTDWAFMLRRIMSELQQQFNIQREIPEDPEQLRLQFANWLAMAASKSRLLLALDALDQLEDRDGALDLVWLPEQLPANLRLILSTLPGRSLEAIRNRGWQEFEIQPLDISERKLVTEEYLSLYRKKLATEHLERIAQAPQSSNPLFLRSVLDELRLFGEHEYLGREIDRYLSAQSIPALFEKVLERYEKDYNRDRPGLVQEALSLIVAARRGMSETELLELLGSDEAPLPHAYWSPFYLAAESSLINRSGMIGIFHTYFREAIEQRYLPTQAERKSTHCKLAAYFERREPDIRTVEELPWQWMQAEEWQHLIDCLADLEFLKHAWKQSETDVRTYWTQVEAHSQTTLLDVYQPVLETPLEHSKAIAMVASLLYEMGYPTEALKLQEVRMQLAREEDDLPEFVSALQWKARMLRDRGDLDEAMQIQKELEKLFRDLDDSPGLTSTLNSQAVILKLKGELQAALELHKEQERLSVECGDRYAQAESLYNQGTIRFMQGDLPSALDLFQQAEQIVREMDNKAVMADCMAARGVIFLRQGNLQAAQEQLEGAEQIQRMLGDKAHLKVTLGNQALIHRSRGRLEKAMAIHKEQERISRELGDKETLATSLNGQALIYKSQGDLQNAMVCFRKVEEVARHVGFAQALQVALGNQASILHQQGKLDQALDFREEEVEICRRAGYKHDLTKALYTYSELLYDLKSYEEGLSAARDAYELASELGMQEMAHELEMKWFPP